MASSIKWAEGLVVVLRVGRGQEAAGAELAGLLGELTPFLESVVTHSLEIPPIAVPAVDLAKISPGFAGKNGRFDGVVRFDAKASRVALEGKVVAH